MSQLLLHLQSEILRKAMVDMALGAGTTGIGDVWPIYANKDVDLPDNLIVVKNTTNLDQGNSQLSGEYYEFYGVQITVRGKNYRTAAVKANAILHSLCANLYTRYVTIDSSTYCIQCFNKEGSLMNLGDDNPNTKRELITINGLCPIAMIV